MALNLDNCIFEKCGTAIKANNNADINMTNSKIIDCVRGIVLVEDLNDILIRIQDLKLDTKRDEHLRLKTIALIKSQLSSPTEEFFTSLRSIFEGATGSMVYMVVSTWANSLTI